MDDEILNRLQSQARVATAHDAVVNNECVYTFHSPFTSEAGIVVNLSTFMGTVQELAFVEGSDNDKKQQQLFVRIVKTRVEKPPPSDEAAPAPAPTKLAIGVEGGFPTEDDKYEIVSHHSVVVLERQGEEGGEQQPPPRVVVELPYTDSNKESLFPETIRKSVDSILCHSGLLTQQDVKVWQLDADEPVPISKYAADLPFIDNGVTIDPNPSSWKCAKSGETQNLWLNLSTGCIGGGRRNWDGSGGSNGALDHYEETGKLYPLVVKLGTITADLDTADCYSYAPDEDGPVKIPNLAELLQKRGINVVAMQKTVKSTAELEVELNATYAFDKITEAGSELTPVAGPGLQGLQNLGNSCYMNSVLQCLFSLPELAKRYGSGSSNVKQRHALGKNVDPTKAPTDLLCQTTKVACALTSGVFCAPLPATPSNEADNNPKYRLAPRMFKHVVGKDHAEFRTGHQQDAEEFWRYMLDQLDRAELAAAAKGGPRRAGLVVKSSTTNDDDDSQPLYSSSYLFSFSTTDRLVCAADGRIKYEKGCTERILSLPIPMEKAVVVMEEAENENPNKDMEPETEDIGSPENKRQKSEDEKKKKPVPTISFEACVEEWAAGTADERKWRHLQNAKHPATKQTRISNFPRYLIIQMLRYTAGADWTPIKLEVNVDIPEEIDLEQYKATGPQEGEDLVPEAVEVDNAAALSEAATASPPPLDENALAQLMDMGFTLNSCKRALSAVGGNDIEAAMNWVFEHNMDPDFNDPLPEPSDSEAGAGSSDSGVDEGVVQSLVESLGCFTADQVRAALKETNSAADRAADWLFSHMDDLDGAIAALQSKAEASSSANASSAPSLPLEDGSGKYVMIGMISHIGKCTGAGHYVAHLKKDGKWVIFNDEKVALSSQPPFPHAYLYLFQRKDTIGAPHQNY